MDKDTKLIRSGLMVLMALAFACATNAQTATQWMGWGDDAMARGDHYGASRFYGHALELEPGLLELQWRIAEACRLSQQYPQAAANYEKVVKKDAGRKHPEAMRWLAEMQMCAADYDAALRTWNKVKQKEHDNSSFTEKRAENGIKGCALAKELMAAPEEVEVEHLPTTVNTYDSEFGGRIGFDSALWFTSLRGAVNSEGEVLDTAAYHVAIYRSAENAGGLVTAERVKTPFAWEADNANVCWGENGRVYFTQCNAAVPCAVYTSTGSSPQLLEGIGVGVSTQPMAARIDGSWKLFFASDRPGGEGGMDIWMGNLNGVEVMDIHPLGAPVNTPGNECCPFYDEAQHKLYFSSDFLPGMGGYDNFMCEHRDDVFREPQNFKYPLNSPANDLYPTFDMRTMSGYFTSNRIGSLAAKGETCCNDIYAFRYDAPVEVAPLPVDTNVVLAVKRITSLREKLPVRLYFHNDEPEPRSWDTLTAQTYEQTYRAYKDRVPDYHEAWKENHGSIDAFFLNSVDGGFQQLGEFLALLREALDQGQQVKLIVRGFASPLAKSDYNVNLSLRRIQSLINHLRAVDGGAFVPYLDGTAASGGRLLIGKKPFGETQAVEGVSDVLEDLRNSVYSVAAAIERRIEIEQLELADSSANMAKPVAQQSLIDVGEVEMNHATQAVFTLRNEGLLPLHVLKMHEDCGCTHAAMDPAAIAPGGARAITVDFNGHAPEGDFKRTVTITTDGDPSTLVLTITGTIVLPR